MPDLDFLPRGIRGPVKAVAAALVIAAGAITTYLWLEATLVSRAVAASRDSVSEMRTDVSAIRQDSRFTRCALVVHMRAGSATDLLLCDEQAAASTGKGR